MAGHARTCRPVQSPQICEQNRRGRLTLVNGCLRPLPPVHSPATLGTPATAQPNPPGRRDLGDVLLESLIGIHCRGCR
jgi:hypothetical protein